MATVHRTGSPFRADTNAVQIAIPAEGPSLGDGARRNMNVDVMLREERLRQSKLLASEPRIPHGRLRGFLHHIAQLSRQGKLPVAGYHGDLNVDDVPASGV